MTMSVNVDPRGHVGFLVPAIDFSFRHTGWDRSDIDVVVGEPRAWEPGPTLSNNFGFGGHNGSIIIGPA